MVIEKLVLSGGLSLAWLLFADASTEVVSFNWQNLTALGVLSIVLIFLVTKYMPDQSKASTAAATEALRVQSDQAKAFAEAAKMQTEASVRATAEATKTATQAMADMHKDFVSTLDTMHGRYHDDNTAIVDAVGNLAQHCAASNGSGAKIHALRKQREEDHQ